MTLALLAALFALTSCYTPGPLKADRDPDDLFAPSEADVIVVDAVLFVDAPLPPVDLRRTVAPGELYWAPDAALTGASVSILQGETRYDYVADPMISGRYLPPASAPLVASATRYDLLVISAGDLDVRATTTTPPRMRIAELVLFDLDEDQEKIELRRLRLFSEIGEDVFEVSENQLEHTVGFLDVRLQSESEAVSYQFGINNLENASPLLYSGDLFDDDDLDDLERDETSRLLRLEDEGLFLSWEGINYAGRHKVKVFAVDENWFDLVRTDNVDADREGGEAGQSFQRPLFHVENGIGLFASAAVDSFGFFVRPEGSPPCSGCECWGCGDRNAWSGVLDLDTGRGRLRYDRDVGTGATCELSYEIIEATPLEPCPDCLFAWEFELGKLTVYRDRGACDEAEYWKGQRFRFGHGVNVIGSEGGTPQHGLYLSVDSADNWWPMETGWSLVLPTTSEIRWLFGFSGD
ncbi:MAG: hypothetical protein HN712_20770 [Gemmatimonadetes bacterium]|nr:hypothetical protein [Gemmatimonadota bacterium]